MPANNPAELHDRARAQGLPVVSVRWHEDQYEIILDETATLSQRQAALGLEQSFLSEAKPNPRTPVNVTDALVLLQLNPTEEERELAKSILEDYGSSIAR